MCACVWEWAWVRSCGTHDTNRVAGGRVQAQAACAGAGHRQALATDAGRRPRRHCARHVMGAARSLHGGRALQSSPKPSRKPQAASPKQSPSPSPSPIPSAESSPNPSPSPSPSPIPDAPRRPPPVCSRRPGVCEIAPALAVASWPCCPSSRCTPRDWPAVVRQAARTQHRQYFSSQCSLRAVPDTYFCTCAAPMTPPRRDEIHTRSLLSVPAQLQQSTGHLA